MTDLCWVPRPFVLNTHAVSAEFHWTCLSCQSLVFAGQCGTKRKTWVNLRTHGTKNIIPNDSTSEQDVFKVPFQTNLCTAAESVRTSKSKPKKNKTTKDCVLFFVIHQCPVIPNLFQHPRIPSNNIARMSGGIKRNMPTMQAACPQTGICEPISDQGLRNLEHSPNSWQRG